MLFGTSGFEKAKNLNSIKRRDKNMKKTMIAIIGMLVIGLSFTGCQGIEAPVIKFSMCGDDGYTYTMIGLMWGSTNGMTTANVEDYLDRDSESNNSHQGGGGSCHGGSCSDK